MAYVFLFVSLSSLSFVFVIALSLPCLHSLFSSLGSCISKISCSLFLFLYSNGRFRNGFFEVDDGAQSRKEEYLFLFFSFFINENVRSHRPSVFFLFFSFFVHMYTDTYTYICLIVFLAGAT